MELIIIIQGAFTIILLLGMAKLYYEVKKGNYDHQQIKTAQRASQKRERTMMKRRVK